MNDKPSQPTRGTSLRAMIRSRLDAGQLQFEGIWRALQAEYPHRHIAWSYVQRIGREWAIEGLEHRSVMNEKPTQPTDPRVAVVIAQIQSVCSDGNSDAKRVAIDVLSALDAHAGAEERRLGNPERPDPEQIIAATFRTCCWDYMIEVPKDRDAVEASRRIISALRRAGWSLSCRAKGGVADGQ